MTCCLIKILPIGKSPIFSITNEGNEGGFLRKKSLLLRKAETRGNHQKKIISIFKFVEIDLFDCLFFNLLPVIKS